MNEGTNHMGNHLSQEQMIGYLKEELSSSEMNAVERHLLDCELCADAMGGLESHDLDKFVIETAELQKQISQRTSRKSFNYRYYGI